ncbi:hypothetical protein DL769_001766 [Monosporascus sp. CRB-8-3]|nr:hypothetical protein DL769_001766 [Monosporascus sp. CRB-8-3]
MSSSAPYHYTSDSKEPTTLGNNILLFEPSRQGDSQPAGDGTSYPSLIILCTWMGGATTRRIAKYTAGYRDAYPDSWILLIRTVFLDISVRSFDTIRSGLTPARSAITSILQRQDKSDGSGGILLHIFSHGGCNMAIQLAESMRAEYGTLLIDNLRQIVYDCCPGDGSFQRAYNAALLSLPTQQPVRTIGIPAVFAAVGVITGLQQAGIMHSIPDMRHALHDTDLFGTRARRIYLFSQADSAVQVADVVSHIQKGKELGLHVGAVMFTRAPHCALVTEDAPKYWNVIKHTWAGKSFPKLSLDMALREGAKL